jgi:aminopeptidase
MLTTVRKSLAIVCALSAGAWMAACGEAQVPERATTTAPPAAPAPAAAPKKAPTDLEQLAERLVNQSAGIKAGELVLVSGGAQDQDLLESGRTGTKGR